MGHISSDQSTNTPPAWRPAWFCVCPEALHPDSKYNLSCDFCEDLCEDLALIIYSLLVQ